MHPVGMSQEPIALTSHVASQLAKARSARSRSEVALAYPRGNTGRARVPIREPMLIAEDLGRILAGASGENGGHDAGYVR